jgi:putative protein kinase ArgK-like GTPase of G3E family
LAKVITLAESTKKDHRIQFEDILNSVVSDASYKKDKISSFRIGITGPPGAGFHILIDFVILTIW